MWPSDGSWFLLSFWAWSLTKFVMLWRGGLEPDKVCSDYPHANSLSDKCIEEALGMLANQETKAAAGPSLTPMPYRWIPYSERRLWSSGSYWLWANMTVPSLPYRSMHANFKTYRSSSLIQRFHLFNTDPCMQISEPTDLLSYVMLCRTQKCWAKCEIALKMEV